MPTPSDRRVNEQFSSSSFEMLTRDLGASVMSLDESSTRQVISEQISSLLAMVREPLQEYMAHHPDTDERIIRPQDQYLGPNARG